MASAAGLDDILAELWALPPPAPTNLYQQPAFLALERYCGEHYPAAKTGFGRTFAFGDALRALGLPCFTPQAPGTVRDAASRLVEAMEAETVTRRYLCPLDLADDLPPMVFGAATVGRFTAGDLAALFNAERLARFYPGDPVDFGRLAMFHWLVIEEEVALPNLIATRAFPFFEDMSQDLGAIDPHVGAHALPVIEALFALLLAPWEDWHWDSRSDWRGFRIPWVHVETGDLFARPRVVPSADLLSWQPHSYVQDGEEIETERPIEIHLDEAAAAAELGKIDHAWWRQIEAAMASDLFSTPVRHFLVRAFFSDGMDEIIAHMTAVEAALGMKADFEGNPPPGVRKMGATRRLTCRVEALLGDSGLAADYAALFELRSGYLHGRSFTGKVPGSETARARRVARRVARALVDASGGPGGQANREDFLWALG